ncbi:MAG TPA: histidine kinase [Cyanobacteria bacterium UBA8530]|nr:histidine kinase [Cyanobacteria bacterium UBA8530]
MNKAKSPFGKYNGNEAEYVWHALDTEDPENKSISWVQRFEEAFAAKVGASYAIAVNSGTSGLHAALYAAGVGPGDEVIQPAMTVVMDSYATIHLGGVPVFADIVPETQHIDPADIVRKITPRTKAILTVSWQGLPVDLDPILEIAREHGLVVVDDSAQTMMGRYKGKISGANAHIGVYSFENKKHLTTGSEGGMIVTSDPELATRARKFAGIGYKHMTSTAGRTHLALSAVQDPSYERFDTIGLNYRMNAVSAAIGLAQLERVDHIVARRQACGRLFLEAIAGCSWMVPQRVATEIEHSFYTFAVDYRGEAERGVKWKDFYHRYLDLGGDGFYGCVVTPYLEPALRGREFGGRRMERGLCPKAEALQLRVMQFKTNYRDLGLARQKAEILSRLIDEIGR